VLLGEIMTSDSRQICSCGLPDIDGSNCARCGSRIPPKRLALLLKSARAKEVEINASDDEDEVYEYKHSLNKTIRDGGVPLFTTFDVPGREIAESLGMISGVGNAMFTLTGTSARMTNRATTKALIQLFAEAERIDADAVVGVNLALDSFSKAFVQQLAVFTGTAVKLKK
jgi:uncharacterized protein YbjQ (UPF0145 family)